MRFDEPARTLIEAGRRLLASPNNEDEADRTLIRAEAALEQIRARMSGDLFNPEPARSDAEKA